MKKYRKALLLSMCAAALVIGSVFGTIAYLTDTEAVTNTFSVGRVGLTLNEADVKADGTYETDKTARVIKNEYHLIPGHTYIKDPTVYIDADSEDCYLFVKVENGIKDIETTDDTRTIAAQMERLNWVKIDGNGDGNVDDTDNVYVLAKGKDDTKYKYTVSKGAEVVVFEHFTIDGDKTVNVPDGEKPADGKVDLTPYESAEVTVTAYAVQAVGFDTSLDAWEATFGK